MAITINSASPSGGQPSAPLRVVVLDVDLDNSYPAGGYDVSDQLEGGTVRAAERILDYDGSTLRWLTVLPTGKVAALVNTNGAPGADTSPTTDVSGHAGVQLWCIVE